MKRLSTIVFLLFVIILGFTSSYAKPKYIATNNRRVSILLPSLVTPRLFYIPKPVWTPYMDSLARCYESEYNLWPGTLHSFALQESAYDTDAFRVETGYVNQGGAYSKEVARQAELFCLDTNHKFYLPIALEREQRGSSFGLFQDMGQIFRELGYDKMYIQPSTKEQFYYFAVDATRRLKSAGRPRTLRRLASSWNTGNPNKAQYGSYANNIAKYQKKFAY